MTVEIPLIAEAKDQEGRDRLIWWAWSYHYCSFRGEENSINNFLGTRRLTVYNVLGKPIIRTENNELLIQINDKEFISLNSGKIILGKVIRTQKANEFLFNGHKVLYDGISHKNVQRIFLFYGTGFKNPIPGEIALGDRHDCNLGSSGSVDLCETFEG